MPYKFNPFTCNLDFYTTSSGGITGPSSSTDKAITRWNGTTGNVVQDSPNTEVQDSGAVSAQGFITRRKVDDTVTVKTGYAWIAPSVEMAPGGIIILESDSQLIIE